MDNWWTAIKQHISSSRWLWRCSRFCHQQQTVSDILLSRLGQKQRPENVAASKY